MRVDTVRIHGNLDNNNQLYSLSTFNVNKVCWKIKLGSDVRSLVHKIFYDAMADICSDFVCQGKLSQHHWSSLLQFVYVCDEFDIGLLWTVCLYLCGAWESRVYFSEKWLDYQRWSCLESEKIVQLKHNQTEQAQYWRLMKTNVQKMNESLIF